MLVGEISLSAATQLFRDICIDFTREGWISYARITPLGWLCIVFILYLFFCLGRWWGNRRAIAKLKN